MIMNFECMHPADQIVTIMERIYACGMTTTSGGNLSILDDNGDIWITPGSVDKGSLTRNDIIQFNLPALRVSSLCLQVVFTL